MAYDPYPGTGIRTWHVVVFLGFVVLVADIASIQMLGNNKTTSFQFVSAPQTPPASKKETTLPPDTNLSGIMVEAGTPIAPGDQVNVVASFGNDELKDFELLTNVPVFGIDRNPTSNRNPSRDVDLVKLALTDKQTTALDLARARGCTVTLVRRDATKSAETDKKYDIDEVIRSLERATQLPEAPPPRPVNENR